MEPCADGILVAWSNAPGAIWLDTALVLVELLELLEPPLLEMLEVVKPEVVFGVEFTVRPPDAIALEIFTGVAVVYL